LVHLKEFGPYRPRNKHSNIDVVIKSLVFVCFLNEGFQLEILGQASFSSKAAIESKIRTMVNIIEFHDIHSIFTLYDVA
jgi:hypothetical protein